MKGDYSRDTFDPARRFSQLLLQQGRVVIDADQNEQTSILLHYLRTLAADLIGAHGGPIAQLGFEVVPKPKNGDPGKLDNFTLGVGRYYVDGVLCENAATSSYKVQASYDQIDLSTLALPLLVYLDVWERHITAIEDPRIREIAL